MSDQTHHLSSQPTYTGHRARLLVVDDDTHLRQGLRDLLSLMGYEVEEARSGQEALLLLADKSYDLMVLDMQMPGMNGVEVMQHVKHDYPDLMIIVLTAHATVESAITAVRSNAVDYMLKPFEVEELSAAISEALKDRAETIKRRRLLNVIGNALDVLRQAEPSAANPLEPTDSHPEHLLRSGPLALDLGKREAMLNIEGKPPYTIKLTENETAILATLMRNPQKVLSWSQLAHATTGYALDKMEARNMVRLCIHRLRQKIDTAPGSPPLIRTVRGRGYFFSPS